jgi:hypothetical protein
MQILPVSDGCGREGMLHHHLQKGHPPFSFADYEISFTLAQTYLHEANIFEFSVHSIPGRGTERLQ